MTVSELIEKLQILPQDAEIEVAKGPLVITAPATKVFNLHNYVIIWAHHD